ncbi:MAG: PAS domain S-box protein [Ignavibacterium sp.]|nr:PAS domain S-box protein [Ignavibacterium sp.]
MSQVSYDKFPLRYLIYFLIIAFIISIAGYLFYLQRKMELEENLSRHILAIKEIKLEQIEREQLQRKNVLESFLNLPEVNQNLVNILTTGNTFRYEKNINQLANDLINNVGFSSINIFNKKAELFYSSDEAYNIRQNFLQQELAVILEKDSTSTSNMYVSDNRYLMQAIASPIRFKGEVKGYIWAEFSFFEFLHPIMFYSRQEPGDVEFILFKVDSDIAFLLKDFSEDIRSALLTLPLNADDKETLRSVLGEKDLIKGLNFRGTKNFVSVKTIAGTDWTLITKIDEQKIVSSLENTAYAIFSIVILLIILSASITYAIWKRSRLHFLSKTFRLQKEKDAISQRYTSLTKYANDMILSVDRSGKILETNQKTTDTYGYTREELLSMNLLDLSVNPSSDSKLIFSSINTDAGILFETNHKRKDGSVVPVEISSKLIRQDDEEILLSIIRDNTERRKLQTELILAKDRAEQNDRLKTIILANMSHELNTPMSGIIGFSEILMIELENSNHNELAKMIHKSSTRLNDTLTSILDLSKLEAERFSLKFDNINLTAILRESVESFIEPAQQKNIDIKTVISKEEIIIKAETNILMKILKNVLGNAIKYIQHGWIIVSADIQNGKAIIKVEDTGIGIPQTDLEKIFEPFRQVSEGSTRIYEGTGLGLTITKKFVELLNGEIKIDSRENEGTTVSLFFPLA